MTKAYLFTAKSNLHVGAGNSNYGVIDNLVQRDPTDQFPTVFASSLKGALREFFKTDKGKGETETSKVFGGPDDGRSTFILSEAYLLGIPVRSNKFPYLMATSPYLLRKFRTVMEEDYGLTIPQELKDVIEVMEKVLVEPEIPILIGETPAQDLIIEDYQIIGRFPEQVNAADDVLIDKLALLLGNKTRVVLLSDEDMAHQCSDYALPVLARNSLEDGRSTNLWYEQIVPREAVFYFVVDAQNDKLTDLLDENPLVQMGANASIGYGRCKITKLTLSNESDR